MELTDLIPSGAGLLTTIIGLVSMWFKFQNKVENLEKMDGGQEKRIDDIVKWSHDHEREASDFRERLNKEISEVRGSILVINEQFKQIMMALNDIKKEILELKKEKLVHYGKE